MFVMVFIKCALTTLELQKALSIVTGVEPCDKLALSPPQERWVPANILHFTFLLNLSG